MSLDSFALRPTYRRSGKVRWGRLPLVLPISLLVAVAMGAVLCWTLSAGLYYAFITPLILTLPVLAAAHLLVRTSHCRSVIVATMLGALLGFVMYVSSFHAHQVWLQGPAAIHRLDALPGFIAWRMENDVQIDERLPQPQKPETRGNWLRFGCELLAVAIAVAGISCVAASSAYCEACSQWMRLGLHLAPSGTAQKIAEYLAAGRIAELPPIAGGGASFAKSAMIKVECCRRAGQSETCLAYLTLQESDPGGVFRRAKVEKILGGGQITPEELGWLSRSIPALAPLAPPGFAAPAAARSAASSAAPLVPVPAASGRECAQIETLPPDAGQRIFTKTNTAIAMCLSLLPLAALAGGIGLLVTGWWSWPANLSDTTRLILAMASFFVGGMATLFGLVVTYVNLDYFNMQYCLAMARNEIGLRPGAIVDPRDPRAVFVEIVPRERWTDIVADKASDGGFVLVDEGRRQVLFEGIKQRYRIPESAIVRCEAEPTQPQAGRFAMYATVLQFQVASAAGDGGNAASVWEVPFMVRPMTFTRFSGAYRRRSCEELAERIRGMKG